MELCFYLEILHTICNKIYFVVFKAKVIALVNIFKPFFPHVALIS